MKAVIQRVTSATLKIDGNLVSEIGAGLVVYLGIIKGDTEKDAEYFAKKIANMRIFEDENGKLMYSAIDKGYEVLLVSQFTLAGNTSHGNRPDFTVAELPAIAKPLYEYTGKLIEQTGLAVKYGVFGADMKILQTNDGPVTIIM